MMAPEPSFPERDRLSSETREILQQALASYAKSGTDGDGVMDSALARMAAEARERAIPPEEVLVELKTVWNTLPEISSWSIARDRAAMLQRIVTMCIKTYYR